MLIVDAHLDLAMNALQWNRDLLTSVYTIRVQEKDTPGKGRGQGTVAFPDMRRGRIALSFALFNGTSPTTAKSVAGGPGLLGSHAVCCFVALMQRCSTFHGPSRQCAIRLM